MNLNPLQILSTRISIKSGIAILLLVLYVILTFIVYFQLVVPSFERGTTSKDFSVDSTVYVYFADSIRGGRPDPWVLESLTGYANTLYMPVFMSLVLKSNFLIMLANYAMVIVSVVLLKRSYPLSLTAFLPLMALNPTTATSILCVNKEVVDLLVLSLFLFARMKRHHWLLPFIFLLSFFNRWETCSVLIAFMFLKSRFNPFQKKRWTTIFLLILMLNFLMPLLASRLLTWKFEEVTSGTTVVLLDRLQLNYLYVLAVIPKIADNLFGQLLDHQVWEIGGSWLMINLFNNLANLIIVMMAYFKRQLNLRSDLIYLAAVGSVIIAQSLAIQPRYFYFVYVLLCLQLSLKRPVAAADSPNVLSAYPRLVHA
jgi:hypothetical protein